MRITIISSIISFFTVIPLLAQNNLITNIQGRETISLNGTWNYIIDPYETGFYNYHYRERNEDDREAYWQDSEVKDKSERIEHGYEEPYTIEVPGDWNSQEEKFLYYEGTVWYQRNFDLDRLQQDERVYLYFGAVNYEAHVYLNGKKIGSHKGGFTPFNFEIPKNILKAKDNFLVVKVDNKRHSGEVPSLNIDWWNFGGITRDVDLVIVPKEFIQQYALHLDQNQDISTAKKKQKFKLKGSVSLNKSVTEAKMVVEIPELNLRKDYTFSGKKLDFEFEAKKLELWSPDNPKLYDVTFRFADEELNDKIGFRTIETSGKDILLNGEPVFLRGICIHEEIPEEARRAHSKKDAERLLGWSKDLNANMVRLAHYPHNENMIKTADSLGIMVWSEIPVYWALDFESEDVLIKAEKQLEEMITRDRNRASVIIWSVGNETPVNPHRTEFMKSLIFKSKKMDNTRLISAALQVHSENGVFRINDPLVEFTDIISVNEYLGWYGGFPDDAQTVEWEVSYTNLYSLVRPVQVQKEVFMQIKELVGVKNTRNGFMKNKLK